MNTSYSGSSVPKSSTPNVSNNNPSSGSKRNWTIQEIRSLVQLKFGKRPCWYQVKAALALSSGKDVIGCAPTGAGKTLSFWIPLIMALEEGRDVMTMVVTPLNLLGKQNQASLEKAGISAIAINKKNANSRTWKVRKNCRCRQSLTNLS